MKIIQLFALVICLFVSFPTLAATNSLTCKVAGCNNELCVSKYGKNPPICKKGDQAKTAALKNCYKDARCARQQNGNCEWSVDQKLEQCVNAAKPAAKTPEKPKAKSAAKK
jgi:hypothetical protein